VLRGRGGPEKKRLRGREVLRVRKCKEGGRAGLRDGLRALGRAEEGWSAEKRGVRGEKKKKEPGEQREVPQEASDGLGGSHLI